MSAGISSPAAEGPRELARLSSVMTDARERNFWLGLTCAAVIHAAIIIGMVGFAPRQMGEPDGKRDAINVDIVDAADFAGRPAPSPAESNPQPQPQTQPTPPSQPQPPAEPVQESKPAPPAEAVQPAPAPAPKQQQASPWSLDPEALDRAAPPGQQRKTDTPSKTTPMPPAKTAPSAKTSPQQPTLALPNLAFPQIPMSAPGRSAAVGRPADITRSGENDEFGRGVVRALRQTMPAPRGVLGRVTIRLLLSETGNLIDAQLIRSGGDGGLDQSVVFAAKQSSFPIPPVGSTTSDRTFLVTYIYH